MEKTRYLEDNERQFIGAIMVIGVWEPPGSKKNINVDLQLLEKFMDLAESMNPDIELADSDLASAGIQQENWVMSLESEAWQVLVQVDTPNLRNLAFFFTIVERDVSGWEAGKMSPVISIVKELKKRSEFTAEMRRWIKEHTRNRYLPYGSAL
ncbi:MAG: hypothetical protein CMQ40_09320 [Gammaproteobacteria bacterium]|nr:hypothetical protein [Gammaproteobacteria bacterium]